MTIKINKDSIKKAAKWFINKIKSLRKKDVVGKDIDLTKVKSIKDFSKKMHIGFIYTHAYDPKLKDTLPFYDTLPLFTPVKLMGDRILAFNFHYLPPKDREAFLNEYYNTLLKQAQSYGYEDLNDVPESQLSRWCQNILEDVYLLATTSPGNCLRSCVRTYLYSNIISRITPIEFDEWDNVANLILPRFVKESASTIYKKVKDDCKKYKNNTRKNIFK